MEPEVQKEVRKSGKRNIITVSLMVFILLMLAVAGQFIYTLMKYDKVYNGVTMNGTNIGGFTRNELEQHLKTQFEDKVKDLNIVLKTDNKELKTSYSELGIAYDKTKAEERAFTVGRTGNIFNRLYEILQAKRSGIRIDVPLSINEKILQSYVDKFYNETLIEVKQSDILIQDDKVTILSGHHGENIDKSKVISQLEEALQTIGNINLTVDIIKVPVEQINTNDLMKQINLEPVDAGFKVENGKLIIIPHIMGRKIEEAAFIDAVAELNKQENIKKIIAVESVKPEITTEIANSRLFKDTLGTMKSHFSTNTENNKNRATNMKLAASKINGLILAPGDEFSFNKVVGPRTEKEGYQAAHVYVSGKVIDGIGGGICQVSSTLYNAVLKADLQVLARRNHTFTVSYVPKGQDATVSYGSTDFKFKNDTKWPLQVLVNVTDDNYINFTLKGTNDNPGKQVIISSQTIKTIPFTTKYIDDPTRPEGQTYVRQNGGNGYVIDTFKTIKQDGNVISQTKLHRSTYSPLTKEVLRGTKKVADSLQPPAPTPTPGPAQQGVDDAENPPAPVE